MTDRRATRARFLPAAAALLAATLVAGCGDVLPTSSFGMPLPATSGPIVATPAPTAPPVETAAPITFEPEPTDFDTGSPGTPPCDIHALKASRGITEADADDRVTEVVLVAADTCSIDAWPRLVLEDSGGKVLVEADPGGQGGIDLVPGVAYTSEVRLSDWCLGDPAYPVEIRISHAGTAIVVSGDSFPDEGDLPPCAHEDSKPVLSATAWAPKS
jgi:hypothetical protein